MPLVLFDGRVVILKGQISLPVNMEGKEVMVTFIVVRSFSLYTEILGRSWIHAMRAVPSTLHVNVKFPTEYGIAVVRGNQQMARKCLVAAVGWKGKQVEQKETTKKAYSKQLSKPRGEVRASCAEKLMKVKIFPDTDRYFQIGTSMKNQDKVEMLLFLMQNVDVFAWSPYEVPRVDPEFIVHKLNVDPSFPPKKQKLRRAAKEHVDAVNLEVQKLKETGVIREIFFPEWLANTVVVKKKNGKWKVCVDFTNLNRACPKDPFPMPKIDQLVDATYGH